MRNLLIIVSAAAAFCAAWRQGAAAENSVPRPEHPFPQMVRAEWLNLNGVWEFAETDDAQANFVNRPKWPDTIVVPFCRESKLSGLARKGFIKNVWYRRTFRKPDAWKSPRVRLHVGACDWRTTVWINAQEAGRHTGGSSPITFDITDRLKPGDNVVVVHAFDDTRSGLQASGKQAHSLQSEGCVYTRTTGIWQTVWLEGVGSTYLGDVRMTADPANGRLLLQTEVTGPCAGLRVEAVATTAGRPAGRAVAPADWRNGQLVLPLSEKHLWSPSDPFLYDLKLRLIAPGGRVVDEVDSYCGLRDVTISGAAILVNGRAIFQRTVLDQGFYPDGIWTAPTDAALRRDIELSQAVGFNGARLHQKVFEPRFLYWADKLGYMVWGEYPNWGLNYERHEIDLPVIDEWTQIVRRDRNHPAIVGWCPFNETPPSANPLQGVIVAVTRAVDPTRPIIESSGYAHAMPDPDVLDAHDYDQNPVSFRQRWTAAMGDGAALPARYRGDAPAKRLPFFVSEYGGIGWNLAGGWGYGNAPKTLDEFYARFQGLTDALLDNRQMFGYCYTQLTDIEQEQNGMYTYQRKPKFDVARLHKIQSRAAAYEKDPPVKTAKSPTTVWRVLVGAAPDGAAAKPWRYTTTASPADWTAPALDDSAWKTGRGAFGSKGGFESLIHTPWTGRDIWLRRQFDCDGAAFARAMLVCHYDNGTEVYVNGKPIWKGVQWNDRYDGFDVTDALRKALRPGSNTIAIHCHQDEGGQLIDAALLIADK